MNFPQAIRQVLSKYADFNGRAMRSEYWWWVLAITVGNASFGIVDSALPYGFLQPIFGLLVLIPNLAVGARRLHDTGRSGWWIALWAASLVIFGAIFTISVFAAVGGAFLAGFEGSEAGGAVFLLGLIGMAVSAMILLVTAVWSIIWLAQRGEDGPNRFGEVPTSES